MTPLLAVALGAAVGAPLRYHLDRAVQRHHDSVFPWGTLTVNIIGCFVLGVVVRGADLGAVGSGTLDLLGVGLCGAFTTYSTFGFETVRLLESGARLAGLANVCLSLVAGLGAASLGWGVAQAIW